MASSTVGEAVAKAAKALRAQVASQAEREEYAERVTAVRKTPHLRKLLIDPTRAVYHDTRACQLALQLAYREGLTVDEAIAALTA